MVRLANAVRLHSLTQTLHGQGGRTGGERLILLLTLFRKATNRLLTVCVCICIYFKIFFKSYVHLCVPENVRTRGTAPREASREPQSPLKLELQITVSFLIRVSEMTPGLLQEQPILS